MIFLQYSTAPVHLYPAYGMHSNTTHTYKFVECQDTQIEIGKNIPLPSSWPFKLVMDHANFMLWVDISNEQVANFEKTPAKNFWECVYEAIKSILYDKL